MFNWKFFSNLKTVFLISCKAVSHLNSAVDTARPFTLAKPITTFRHALHKTKEISIGVDQTFLNPPKISIRDYALQEGHDIIIKCFSITR